MQRVKFNQEFFNLIKMVCINFPIRFGLTTQMGSETPAQFLARFKRSQKEEQLQKDKADLAIADAFCIWYMADKKAEENANDNLPVEYQSEGQGLKGLEALTDSWENCPKGLEDVEEERKVLIANIIKLSGELEVELPKKNKKLEKAALDYHRSILTQFDEVDGEEVD